MHARECTHGVQAKLRSRSALNLKAVGTTQNSFLPCRHQHPPALSSEDRMGHRVVHADKIVMRLLILGIKEYSYRQCRECEWMVTAWAR
jgi:hypothetical protein